MSIKDFSDKIKHYTQIVLEDETTFFVLLLITISLVSFGIGRYSMLSDAPKKGIATVSIPSNTAEVFQEKIEHTTDRYVGSKNSDKYHLPWCSGAQRIAEENKVFFSSKEEAETAGYTPAQNCEGI